MSTKTKRPSTPIAIVGMSCRFPGASSPEEFWRVLDNGVDVVREVPADRWDIDGYYDPNPAQPGKMSTREGAFLEGVEQFDAGFFGITPREAARLDPQQRLLLELSWEALENAGLSADKLAGSETAVFAGLTTNDYAFLQVPDINAFNGHAGMGSGHCIATGRLSYFYDFHGPNAAVDTACSSSMVATHMACQSLRSGECSVALAGGVNVMAAPHMTVFLSEWGVLAPDGRSKAFSDSANGFGRGEGCGFVVLKRLADAQADRDNILAVIKGTAMNQDGRGTRFSASNASAQAAVVRKALQDAGEDPAGISFVETHGTGTPIGDPIEVEALTEVIGSPRSASHRCVLGSVKANVAHLEAAAGVAGLIKTVLCLQHNRIPRQLHIERINPSIRLEGTPFHIPTEPVEWPRGDKPRLAGVSSFGLSGTNTHVIVEEAPATEDEQAAAPSGPQLLTLSARSVDALKDTVASYRSYLEGDDLPDLPSICSTAGVRRSHHPYRVAVAGQSATDLAEKLGNLKDADLSPTPVIAGLPEPVVMVFSGQGSQWPGMALGLLETNDAFRAKLAECDEIFADLSGISILEQLRRAPERSELGQTQVAQPAIFAVQAGLLSVYDSWGIRPDAVTGHSSGEVAAAYAAGVFTLEDALEVMYHRSRLMQLASGKGRMAAIALGRDEAAELIAGSALELAAFNGPRLSVVAGRPDAVSAFLEEQTSRGVFCKDLGVDYAFHSSQMDPFLDELSSSLTGIEPKKAGIDMVSTVTGDLVDGPEITGGHWADNIRHPVRFVDAVARLLESGHKMFVEVGPHPVLGAPLNQCLKASDVSGTVINSLRQGQNDLLQMLKAAGAIYAAGCDLDLDALFGGKRKPVRLPNYPWQHRRYWLSTEAFRSPQRPDALPALPQADTAGATGDKDEDLISSFYDRVSESTGDDDVFSHLTFAPFPEVVPGFSWLLAFYDPEGSARFNETVSNAHEQMRRILFRGIDFQSVHTALDFGCGYGTDLISLAGRYPHLQADGYSLSAKQVAIGNQKAAEAGLHGRVNLFERNSAQDEFPRQYDLVMGFEVAHYIRDKDRLFAHIDRHLNDGGYVVLADFIANTVSEIRHEPTNSFFSTKEQWCNLLAQFKLKIVDCVDVSQEMANFLHDPESEKNLALIADRMGGAGGVREHFASYDGLGKLFRKQLATYGLFSVQKDRFSSREDILRVNRDRLANLVPYSQAASRLGEAEPAPAHVSQGANSDCLYELSWVPATPAGAPTSLENEPWIILADDKGIGNAVASELAQRGGRPVLVHAGTQFEQSTDGAYRVDPASSADFERLIAQLQTDLGTAPSAVVHLMGLDTGPWPGDASTLTDDQLRGCGSLVNALRALASSDWQASTKVWIGTSGVHAANNGRPLALAQSALWGLGRTLAAEQPAIWGGLVDLDPALGTDAAAATMVGEIVAGGSEDQVLWSGGSRHVARLRPWTVGSQSGPATLRPDATYLITGGLGGLGGATARACVENGARHLVLLQRSGLPAAGTPGDSLLQHLRAEGAHVEVLEGDVSEAESLAAAMRTIETMPALKGVIHAAGTLDDGILTQLDVGRFRTVFGPKSTGAWNLHLATEEHDLDFFVLYSSVASLLGSPGQANYTAANASLDALAHYRAAQGLPALCINWGPWAEVGMAAAQANRGQRVATRGLESFAPEDGTQILMRLIGQPVTQLCAMKLDSPQFKSSWPRAGHMALLADLPGETKAPVPAAAGAQPTSAPEPQSDIGKSLRDAGGAERERLLEEYVVSQTARVLELRIADVDPRVPLNRMGIDSLMSVELRNHIESDLSVAVPLVSFLEGGSIKDLVAAIGEQLDDAAPGEDPLAAALAQVEQMSDEEVEALLALKKQQLGQ